MKSEEDLVTSLTHTRLTACWPPRLPARRPDLQSSSHQALLMSVPAEQLLMRLPGYKITH